MPRGRRAGGGHVMKRCLLGLVVLCVALVAAAPSASAQGISYPGMKVLHFAAGPYTITPGANLILFDGNQVPKPHEDGFMVRVAPNLHYARPNGKCCGGI